jgi:hypothetical protein
MVTYARAGRGRRIGTVTRTTQKELTMRKLRPLILVSMALLVAIPATGAAKPHRAPAPKKRGHYVGKSSQGLRVSLRVSRNGKVVTLDAPESLSCGDGLELSDGMTYPTRIRKQRTFAESSTESDDWDDDPSIGPGNLTGDYRDNVSGRFYRARRGLYRRVKGKFRSRLTIRDGNGAAAAECDTGWVSFTAKLAKR